MATANVSPITCGNNVMSGTRGALSLERKKANVSIIMIHFITVVLRRPYTKTPLQIAHGIKAAQILLYILYILD